jgi:hypothetical protein
MYTSNYVDVVSDLVLNDALIGTVASLPSLHHAAPDFHACLIHLIDCIGCHTVVQHSQHPRLRHVLQQGAFCMRLSDPAADRKI